MGGFCGLSAWFLWIPAFAGMTEKKEAKVTTQESYFDLSRPTTLTLRVRDLADI